ncbi:recombinase family protein [Burkholderia sp. LS-044]|nr:recombinase family protein [Burkholderia sp. LS-044]
MPVAGGPSGLARGRRARLCVPRRRRWSHNHVVWWLDRLGRSLSHLARIVVELEQQKVRLLSLSGYIDTGSTTSRFTFHMLAALAEFERGLISERTRTGMAAARQRGSSIGRPSGLSAIQREQARALLETQPDDVVAKTFNIRERTLQRRLRKSDSG